MLAAGITIVRDEIEVIEFNLYHYFNQGLDAVIVYDNGSVDGTFEFLKEYSEKDPRVILHNGDGPFYQSEILTFLAREAHRLGYTWVVPFDADELWFSENGLKKDLENIKDADAIKLRLQNFVQSFDYAEDSNSLYSKVEWKIPHENENFKFASQSEVESGARSTVEFPWDYKHILRVSDHIEVGVGVHFYKNASENTITDERFKAYQIPIRSYKHLIKRAEHGLRLTGWGYSRGHGWESQRIGEIFLRGELKKEWSVNTVRDGNIIHYDKTKTQLEYDDTIANWYKDFIEKKV